MTAWPKLSGLAEAFGVPGERVETPGALAALTAADGSFMVDVRIDSGIQNRSFKDIASRLRGA